MGKVKNRLLIVTDYFYPHWTGLSKSLYYMAQALEGNYHITVLTVRHQKGLLLHQRIGKVSIVRSPYLFSFSRAKFSIIIFLDFLREIKNNDIVLINSPSIHILFLAFITKIFHKKLIIFHQGDLILPKGMVNFFIEKVFDITTYASFFIADRLSTYTQDYANSSRVFRPFLHKVLPVILPISLIKIKKEQQKLMKVKRMKKDHILFGFAGRFVEEKGFDILFKAIPTIVEKIPNARFVFAGNLQMEYEDFFQKNKQIYTKIKKYIFVTGLLNDEEMSEYYDNIEYMIVPSRSDCFNLVQAEAMLHGVPIIASNIPGLRFLVQQTGYGILFEAGNPIDLTEKILEAIGNKQKISRNKNKVKEILNNSKNVKAITKLIG